VRTTGLVASETSVITIATKSIASVLSPALRGRRGFPQIYAEGGTAIGKTPEERGNVILRH